MATSLRIVRAIGLVLASASVTGCSGLLYTNVTKPLITNMRSTPANGRVVTTSNQGFKIPFTRVPVSAQWNTNLVGEAARAGGLTTIYYADVQSFSVLGGVWQDSTVRIIGE